MIGHFVAYLAYDKQFVTTNTEQATGYSMGSDSVTTVLRHRLANGCTAISV
jgi:hypothetical protein